MYNRQFVQFARAPAEFVARLWDLSAKKYNNYSIAAVILGYLHFKRSAQLGPLYISYIMVQILNYKIPERGLRQWSNM